MNNDLKGRVAVITGAASGFGLEASRIAARGGMKVVMADVQPDALELAAQDVKALGAEVLAQRTDVSKASRRGGAGRGHGAALRRPALRLQQRRRRCRRADLGADHARTGSG